MEHVSSTHHILRDVNTFTHLAGRMCELLHTGFAKTRHAMVRPFGGSAPLRADNWTSRPAPASNPIALSIGSVGAAIPRYPMTGIAVYCPRAASGHAAAPPKQRHELPPSHAGHGGSSLRDYRRVSLPLSVGTSCGPDTKIDPDRPDVKV